MGFTIWRAMEQAMLQSDFDAEITAFIRSKGVTRCPTVCLAPTQGATAAADRDALRHRAEQREAAREERARTQWLRATAAA
jgi:hypothetical protein